MHELDYQLGEKVLNVARDHLRMYCTWSMHPDHSDAVVYEDDKIRIQEWGCDGVSISLKTEPLEQVYCADMKIGFSGSSVVRKIHIDRFRPGYWVEYLLTLPERLETKRAAEKKAQEEADRKKAEEERKRKEREVRFSPVDDGILFRGAGRS